MSTCSDTKQVDYWTRLSPVQRVIIAVLRAAMSERIKQTQYVDAKYGDFRDDPSQGWLGP